MQTNNKKKTPGWEEKKAQLLKMALEERRKEYHHRDYVPLENIPTWDKESQRRIQGTDGDVQDPSNVNDSLSSKVALYRGDITALEIDAIVNAANNSLLGGGGVDGCIHRAAGSYLLAECRSLNGCETGKAKITGGYDLPAKYVIHTVGPIARGHVSENHKRDLASCYKTSLDLLKEYKLRSIAFPCISTGIYGFPNDPAADTALKTIKDWLKENHDEIDCIIFCVFLEIDFRIYKRKMAEFFPIAAQTATKAQSPPPKKQKGTEEESNQGEDADNLNVADVEMASQSQAMEEVKEPSLQRQSSEETDTSNMAMSQDLSQIIEDVHRDIDEELPTCIEGDPTTDGKINTGDSQAADMDITDQSNAVGKQMEEQQFAESKKDREQDDEDDDDTCNPQEADSDAMNSQLEALPTSDEDESKGKKNEPEEEQ